MMDLPQPVKVWGEIAWPIIASTATTLGAFIPLAFWPGLMGEFMQYLPLTLIIVLGSSLFVALIINPVLTAMYMKLKESEPNFNKVRFIASCRSYPSGNSSST